MAKLGPFAAVQELCLYWSPAIYHQLVAGLHAARPGTARQVRVTRDHSGTSFLGSLIKLGVPGLVSPGEVA